MIKHISVIGTGYVGLVTGVCLAEVGHFVTCIDVDENKVKMLKEGKSPIFEPGLEDLILKTMKQNRLMFTTTHEEGFKDAEVIYIAVGTPQSENGSADLTYIEQAAINIAKNIQRDTIVVTKSTVPVGTNDWIKELIDENKVGNYKVNIVSNPEFLREGSAIGDTFSGDRIVIGTDCEKTFLTMKAINEPFGIPIVHTGVKSAEMIKYASNAFLATKISFINEIASICEKLGANIEDVALGMGMDNRIGRQFLNAGIGYGGSCFPKDTNALVQIAGNIEHQFSLLEAVIEVNNRQQESLVLKALEHLGSLKNKRIAVLGLAFKPNTDDMREAASQVIIKQLFNLNANIVAYDPIAVENAKKLLPQGIQYSTTIEEALKGADAVFIVTEWNEVKAVPLETYPKLMKTAVIFDGRNCYDLEDVRKHAVDYYSVGRPLVRNLNYKVNN
ncbi:UDP-glucose/GDP-mannose dehydrogenase family protein [Bacillus tianshenii]|nr:UDP-glucose/GDP-mannose dehydrogenase family protein [Bacillus tianshenii]